MASFSKMAVWPVGYFRAYSSWLLRNRRAVAGRLKAIEAELARIGDITVIYRTEEKDGNTVATEERVGFGVTKNSSLERLVRAYIANGGNPLDISPFLKPNSREVIPEDGDVAAKTKDIYPFGGLMAPMSANPDEPLPIAGKDTGYGANRGGFMPSDGYDPGRQGGKVNRGSWDSDLFVRYMHQMRSWANQDIKERVQEIEARILKLCDLHEQLEKERDYVLKQAFGGALSGGLSKPLDENLFDGGLRVQVIVQDFYNLLYETDETGKVTAYKANDNAKLLPFTFEDAPSEVTRFPLG